MNDLAGMWMIAFLCTVAGYAMCCVTLVPYIWRTRYRDGISKQYEHYRTYAEQKKLQDTYFKVYPHLKYLDPTYAPHVSRGPAIDIRADDEQLSNLDRRDGVGRHH